MPNVVNKLTWLLLLLFLSLMDIVYCLLIWKLILFHLQHEGALRLPLEVDDPLYIEGRFCKRGWWTGTRGLGWAKRSSNHTCKGLILNPLEVGWSSRRSNGLVQTTLNLLKMVATWRYKDGCNPTWRTYDTGKRTSLKSPTCLMVSGKTCICISCVFQRITTLLDILVYESLYCLYLRDLFSKIFGNSNSNSYMTTVSMLCLGA